VKDAAWCRDRQEKSKAFPPEVTRRELGELENVMRKHIRHIIVIVHVATLMFGIWHWLGLDGAHPVGQTEKGVGISSG